MVKEDRINEMRSLVNQLVLSDEYDTIVMKMMNENEEFNPLEHSISVLNSLRITADRNLDERAKKRVYYELQALVDHLFIPKLTAVQSALGRDLTTEDVYAIVCENSAVEVKPTQAEENN